MLRLIAPTSGGIRRQDAMGNGVFAASRSSGSRRHRGEDFLGDVGEPVMCMASGRVTKVGYPYEDDLSFRYVEVEMPGIGWHRTWYLSPAVQVGDIVLASQSLGDLQDLRGRYPGIRNHVHAEVILGWGMAALLGKRGEYHHQRVYVKPSLFMEGVDD